MNSSVYLDKKSPEHASVSPIAECWDGSALQFKQNEELTPG